MLWPIQESYPGRARVPTAADLEFGEIALKNELITKKQHDEAMKSLKKLKKKYRHRNKLPYHPSVLMNIIIAAAGQSAVARVTKKQQMYPPHPCEDNLNSHLRRRFWLPANPAMRLVRLSQMVNQMVNQMVTLNRNLRLIGRLLRTTCWLRWALM